MPSKPLGAPLRVVLDTNILISAVINKFGPSRQIYNLFRAGKLCLVTSPFQLRELARILRYQRIKKKYRLTETAIKKIERVIRKYSLVVFSETVSDVISQDQDDNRILAAAIEGKADTIVSGDEHLLGLRKYRSISVVSAKNFLQKLGGRLR